MNWEAVVESEMKIYIVVQSISCWEHTLAKLANEEEGGAAGL